MFVPVYLVFVFLFTSITLFAERNHITPDLTFWGNVATAYKGLVGFAGPYTYHRNVFHDFFETGLLVLGILGLFTLLYLVLRTFVQSDPPTPERRARAEGIVRQWGDDTLDYFALRRDKNYFFAADGQSLIAYLYVRGTAMVAADPIGPPGNEARTLDEFLAFCAERGWRVAFFACARPTPTSTASAACTRSTSATRRSCGSTTSASTGPSARRSGRRSNTSRKATPSS